MPLVFEATIEPGRRCSFDLFKKGALDVQVLNDRFNDQIAVFDLCEVVVKVSDGDERCELGNKERRRLRFHRGFESGARDAIRYLLTLER